MLTLVVKGYEMFNNETQRFVTEGDVTLELEHSLVSLARWESKWKKPFLGKESKSTEEILGYVEAMTLTPNVPPEVFQRLSEDNIKELNAYIEDTMTASWFTEVPGAQRQSREVVTAEIIYYWMIALNIPMECQNWHLNKLITLIRVNNQKNTPPKKMSRGDAMAQQRRLNEERRRAQGTRG